MIYPMNFHVPTDEEIHTAFAQGEAAVLAVFHAVATQVAALAQQDRKSTRLNSSHSRAPRMPSSA